MWVKHTKNGKVRFCECYKDPMTDKRRTTSITMDKDTRANRKIAKERLAAMIEQQKANIMTGWGPKGKPPGWKSKYEEWLERQEEIERDFEKQEGKGGFTILKLKEEAGEE